MPQKITVILLTPCALSAPLAHSKYLRVQTERKAQPYFPATPAIEKCKLILMNNSLTLGAHAQRGLLKLGLCVCVCVCVCLLSHISPMEHLFVLKTLSRTQRATKVKIFVGFSLKPLRCRDPALPPLCCRAYSRPFFLLKARMRILAPPSVFPAYNYISAATRLFAFATSCPAQRGKADVPVQFTC